ncbi:glycoside hydrolase 43 family protein [Parasediminibacterium sp. JCM 36343]|uniref:glycoside hydrolase family 43 protein n=1 Tax=Parasediminibacterium sp. JCM 36343 TaxID=3374279 RepID=UPI00397DB58D
MKSVAQFLFLSCFATTVHAQQSLKKAALPVASSNYVSKVWVADNGDGTYKNPIIHADYSDPDAIRVGDDYYLVASSFNYVPGLPILHSKDLVNWTIIGNVFTKQPPYDRYDTVQHGGGVWAPSIRYHNGEFYLYYPDPDLGIYMVKAKNITGPWSEPLLIKKAKGWIDPCPFWDEDGKAYLVNGMAGSRAGIKSSLIINRMSVDGRQLLDDGALIFDGHAKHPTVEGPKVYKRNGYYYILAPAGGVGTGWQLALRSKNIYGPYEEKIVLENGGSITNGPHQGALVETQTGESWFLHFQDKDAYGRIVHLEPVKWVDGWPIMGVVKDGTNVGNPVQVYKKPNVGKTYPIETPQESDDFNGNTLGLQWQWPANPKSNFCFPAGSSYGFLRLYNMPVQDNTANFWTVPNQLTQKFPAPNFTAVTKVTFTPRTDEEETGLVIEGIDYAYISLKQTAAGLVVSQTKCIDAEHGKPEQKTEALPVKSNTVYFKVTVKNVDPASADYAKYNTAKNTKYGNALCVFSYSEDGVNFTAVGEPFAAKCGKWVGAKVGIFAIRHGQTYETGYADYDWFRIEK